MRQLAGAAIVKRQLVGREPQSFAHGEVFRAKAHNIGSNQFWHYFPLRSGLCLDPGAFFFDENEAEA
jgi:hypothetical protein